MIKQAGFTLIEILIALAVFAILATITSTAMYYAFNTRARVTEQAEQLMDLQLAVTFIERDIEQVANRAIRIDDMQLAPALTGTAQSVELTRGGLPNPQSQEKRSSLKRIAYRCSSSQLTRRSWSSLDPIHYKNAKEKTILKNLKKCQFAFISQNLQVLSEWREMNGAINGAAPNTALPKGIQLKITLDNNAELAFLFILPEGLYAQI